MKTENAEAETERLHSEWRRLGLDTSCPCARCWRTANLDSIFDEINDEVVSATAKFPPFNSAHEGFAILKEEVDELWDEVKKKQTTRDVQKLRREAIQVAAMAVRFVEDVVNGQGGKR